MKAKQMPVPMSSFPVDFQHPTRTLISGFFEETVKVGDETRSFYTYIPENLEYCRPCLIVGIPSQADPETYLEQSGLSGFADEKQLFLFLAVAKNNRWNSDGSDAAYLNAVYVAVQARDFYVTMQDNLYLCGLEDATTVAQQAAVQMTSEWSALITMGDLTGDIELTHSETCAKNQGEVELSVQADKAQLPVWMLISERSGWNENAIAYWRAQNHTTEEVFSGAGCDFIWMPGAVRTRNEINEEQTSQIRVKVENSAFCLANLELAWDFVQRTRRHRSVGKKALRNVKDPIACGATLHTMEVDGMMRTWYEYVPKSCTPDRKWPIVVTMHGRGGSAETFFDLSGMSVVAEERKFIAVFPQASIYQQKPDGLRNVLCWSGTYEGKPIDDIAFIRAMLADIECRLPVDPHRRYACGQSSGGMMTDLLGYAAGDLFAAVAPWSALRSSKRMFGTFSQSSHYTPTMLLYGDKDFLCVGSDLDPEFPFPISKEMAASLRSKLEAISCSTGDCAVWENYPITWYSYANRQGFPMLVVGVVDNMVHANYPEESWISYDQFLSRFTQDEDGTLFYGGKKVEF